MSSRARSPHALTIETIEMFEMLTRGGLRT